MRAVFFLVFAVLAGCAAAPGPTESDPPVAAGPADPLPANLWTRPTGSDWNCFLGPTQDSVSPEKGILTTWPASGPRQVWQKKIGISYAMPTIERGRLFLFDRERNRCRLRAWKAETAEELWSFEYDTDYRDMYGYNGGPRCCPVVEGNRVYAYGPEGMLHCVRATDGKLIWKIDTRSEFGVIQNFFGVGSTPLIEGDLLLVQVGGSPKGSDDTDFLELKGNGSGLVAFDKYTGKVRYKVSKELASYASPIVRTIGKQRLCLLFARGGLLGVDAASGREVFHFPWRSRMLESVNASNPVVVGQRVLISECYELGTALLDITAEGIREVWTDRDTSLRRKSLMTHWMTPIHVDGHVYGSSGRHSNDAELRCIELTTGKVKWREPGLSRSSLLLIDGHFLCLGEDGVLRLLKVNSTKYEELASVTLKDADGEALLEYPCWAAPIVSHGLLYVRGKDRLVCLDLIPEKKK